MQMSDLALLRIMRHIQRHKGRCIAGSLDGIEKEFEWEQMLVTRSKKLLDDINSRGTVNTDELVLFLERVKSGSPSYIVVRKIVLDSINDLIRNIFQVLLGDDIEGYGDKFRPRT